MKKTSNGGLPNFTITNRIETEAIQQQKENRSTIRKHLLHNNQNTLTETLNLTNDPSEHYCN